MLVQVGEAVREQLQSLPAEKRRAFVQRFLTLAGNQIEVSRVIVNAQDAKYVTSHTAKQGPIGGGLIAENSDGTLRVDYSIETLLMQASTDALPEVAEELFPE